MTFRDALDLLGERWTLLVIRDVALGVRRFNDLRESTGAPRAVLTDRLRRLVAAGLVQQREYVVPGARPRDEYVLTPSGQTLLPALVALSDWAGESRRPSQQHDVTYHHSRCGGQVKAQLVCECGDHIATGDSIVASVNRLEIA